MIYFSVDSHTFDKQHERIKKTLRNMQQVTRHCYYWYMKFRVLTLANNK